MNEVRRLARDHRLIRAKLDELETALKQEHGWRPLRQTCVSLLPVLRDHVLHEEQMVASCRYELDSQPPTRVERRGPDDPQLLSDLTWLACTGGYGSLPELTPRLLESVAQLRRRIVEEESELFPALTRILARRSAYESARFIFRSSWWE